jgi:F-type H+-transporting ATPase subunit epsilon
VAKPFRCSIVTPAEAVLDEEVAYASIPAWDGQKGVMHGTSPFLTKLGTGALRLDMSSGAARWFLLDGGFAQMQNDVLTLLTDRAIPSEKIDTREAEAELAEAKARIAGTAADLAAVERQQERAMAKLAVAKHR